MYRKPGHLPLTERERRILKFLVDGYSNEEAAALVKQAIQIGITRVNEHCTLHQ
jgi:ATP/maltotriose-dependent transcriptional regulator MalT